MGGFRGGRGGGRGGGFRGGRDGEDPMQLEDIGTLAP